MMRSRFGVGFGVAAIVGAAACGSSDAPPSAGAETPAPDPSGAPATPPPPPPGSSSGTSSPPSPPPPPPPPPASGAGCGAASTLEGNQDLTVAFGGAQRVVHVHVPPTYDPNKPTPVVLNFHGYLSSAPEQDAFSGMSAKADKAGFIAVHPEGTNKSWNGGACCGDAASQKLDDIGYVAAMVNEIATKACVDEKRVYATGLSNGGFLSYRIACELSDRIAAVAPVAAVLGVSTCTPKRAVPILHFHGTSDPLVPYGGSAAIGYPSVADTISAFVKGDACDATGTQTFNQGDTTCQTHGGCAGGAEIVLCTVSGGGHTWPGGTVPSYLGKTTTAINATDAMWDFFVKHPLP